MHYLSILKLIHAGWGRTVGGGNAADTLQQAMLPVAKHSDCSRVNGRLVTVDERSMVCAGGQGKGGCQVNVNRTVDFFFNTNVVEYFEVKIKLRHKL